jgi:hypothetical protein
MSKQNGDQKMEGESDELLRPLLGYMEKLCDPNSISILIVCGRVRQFFLDWMLMILLFLR